MTKNIVFKKLESDDSNFYKYIKEARKWDNKNYCFLGECDDDLMNIFESTYLYFIDDEYVGYGAIFHHPLKNAVSLSYVINPKYRKQGNGTRLIKFLIEETIKNPIIKYIEVEILKKNKNSLSLIEKMDFDFDYFNDEKIVFKKVLKM